MAERLDFFLVSECICTLVSHTDIYPSFCTDHDTVAITIEIEKIQRGPGFWKFNTLLFRDKDYVDMLNEIIDETMRTTFKDVRSKWDYLMFKIKQETIKFASHRKKSQENLLQVFERKLSRMQDKLLNEEANSIFTNDQNLKEVEEIKVEINKIMDDKTKSAMLRSKVDWFMYGEKSSSFFFNLEKYNYTRKNRNRLMREDGTVTTNPREILDEQFKFYNRLFTGVIQEDYSFLDQLDAPKINDMEREEADKVITLDEIKRAIKDMDFNKVPGPDGIPIEFIVFNWKKIGTLFTDLILEMADKGLSIEEGRGVISLLDKPGKDLLKLIHWRPLTLLNSSAKVYSKVLANSLYDVLPKLIHHDQTAFMKGRDIGENLMDLQSIIEHCDKEQIAGLIIAIDFQKAFDNVAWQAYYRILKFFGFGEKYIKMVQRLFTNLRSCTVNNGYASKWIELEKSFRQGCCYSPPAFLLVVETLGLKIRQTESIEGITIGETTKKHSQFADDLWASIKANQQSVDSLFEVLNCFSQFVGLTINYNKTQILRIGSLKNSDIMFITQGTVSWSRRIKVLGIYFSCDKVVNNEWNYEKCFNKIKNIIDSWKYCGLTVMGKVLVINTLVASQLVYLFSHTYTPPEGFFRKLHLLTMKYLWEGKPAKIAYKSLVQNYKNGGLKLVDFQAKNSALKAKWIQKMITKSGAWLAHAMNIIPIGIPQMIENKVQSKDIIGMRSPSIWYDVWIAWAQGIKITEPEDNQVIYEKLWFNSKIRNATGPLHIKHYEKQGIIRIKDIYRLEEKRFKTWQEFRNEFKVRNNFLEYGQLIAAIPDEWKRKLAIITQANKQEIQNSINLDTDKISTKLYWRNIEDNKKEDSGRIFWEQQLNKNLSIENWEKMRENIFQITPLTKLKYFQYRLLGNKVTTNRLRSKWDVSCSDKCSFCKNQVETINHLMWECQIIKNLWNALSRWLKYITKVIVKFDNELIICNNAQGTNKQALNTIILCTKFYIYYCKCDNKLPTVMGSVTAISEYRKLELITAKRTNNLNKFNKKWKNFM